MVSALRFSFNLQIHPDPPADGIAFVIQNAGTGAIGAPPNGGALGYGGDDNNQNPALGIPSSLAIEFDSFQNQWDPRQSMATPAMWQSRVAAPGTTPHIMAKFAL